MLRGLKEIGEFKERLCRAQSAGEYFYLREIASRPEPRVRIGEKEYVMLGSYSYLGLASHPKVISAMKKAIDEFGSGAAGVRLLAGTTPLHTALEEKIAQLTGREAAILFSSGYVANLSVISTLFGKGDFVLIDKLDHASIIDGCILSGADFRFYKHNDMEDLERKISRASCDGNKLVVVDSVFSMDGDVANLPEILRIARKHGAYVMVDEAHAFGVIGKSGRGIEEHFGVFGQVDILMGTLSKAIPSVGAYVAADKDIVDYLKHNARAFVFSASLPPSAVAASLAALEVMEEEAWRVERLRENSKFLIDGLNALGYNTLNSQTPIIPIVLGEEETTLRACKFLFDSGVFISPILYPAVPRKLTRLRAHAMATHSKSDLEHCLEAFRKLRESLFAPSLKG